ncbi:hypothetical protein [Celeribacter naphthalenivorans]|uniref:hypothetical protein n=1 Tax=Celeribacter naphthalenivorans TaxID=1614694 RepID=UPI001CFAEC39|nr:hypothetical protein [Celeribacter naphthalenivorans]
MTVKKQLENLKRLQEVAELSLNAELAKLSEIKREEQPLRLRLAELEASRKQRAECVGGAIDFDMASLMGVDGAWDRWAAKQQRKLMQELAKVAERREMQLERTRKAFGKKDALGKLAERIDKSL